MQFSEIIGNAEVAKALVSMADSGRVAHAMLMYENEGCGALALALAYVQYLNCSNPHDGDSCGECSIMKKFRCGCITDRRITGSAVLRTCTRHKQGQQRPHLLA